MPLNSRGLVRLGLFYLAAGLLISCASSPPAPIETRQGIALDRNQQVLKPEVVSAPRSGAALEHGEPYTVEEGDTLYAIAFRLGADYRLLARANSIEPPYLIYPGQTLSTIDPVAGSVATESVNDAVPHPPTEITGTAAGSAVVGTVNPPPEVIVQTQSKSAPKAQTASKPSAQPGGQPASASAASPKVVVSSSPTTVVKPQPKPKPKPKPVEQTPPPKTQTQVAGEAKLGPVSRWLWPGKGLVERAYSPVLHKGIDIAGQRGDPIYATAAGVVVYAGTGVKGYGALLIVKHNDQFLSAYGHNDVMLVAEGASVSAGQQIARMGSTGTDTIKLHFEIRRKGQPVDPLRLLPRR